jgi:hypothetical protein
LGERHRERILGRQRARAQFLVVLVELRREIYGFADDRGFEPRVIAHGPEDHGPDREGGADGDRIETSHIVVLVVLA